MGRTMLIAAAALAFAVPAAFADDDDWRRGRDRDRDRYGYGNRDRDRGRYEDRDRDRYGYGNRDRDRGRYGDRDRYGYGNGSVYGGSASRVVDRTLSNLRRAANRNRVDSHERDHFNRAMRELSNFRSRQDYSRLSRVEEDLEHLVRADQVHPSDRRMLASDLQAIRQLRNGGYGYNRSLPY